jgi:hypothetical protein
MDHSEAHLQLIEWLLGGGIGIIGFLLVGIGWFYQRALDDIKTRQDKADEKMDAAVALINSEHRLTETRLADDIKTQSNKLSDIQVTVSGFSGSFLPRREWEVERDRIERHSGREKCG